MHHFPAILSSTPKQGTSRSAINKPWHQGKPFQVEAIIWDSEQDIKLIFSIPVAAEAHMAFIAG